jgi:hypothetical protein
LEHILTYGCDAFRLNAGDIDRLETLQGNLVKLENVLYIFFVFLYLPDYWGFYQINKSINTDLARTVNSGIPDDVIFID